MNCLFFLIIFLIKYMCEVFSIAVLWLLGMIDCLLCSDSKKSIVATIIFLTAYNKL